MADATAGLPFLGGQLGLTRMPDGTYAQNSVFIGGAGESSGATVTTVAAATGASTILSANSDRKGRPSVYYDGAASMYLFAGTVVFKVKSWTMSGPNFIGCVAKGYRGQALPSSLLSLGVLVLYNVFGGNASGVQFTAIALQQS